MRAILSLFTALLLSFSNSSNATPLSLEYGITDLGGGLYDYEFDLTLDNNDSSWVLGQSFNWIIFGDAPFGSSSPLTDFVGDTGDLPIGPFLSYSSSSGSHNGPTLLDSSHTGWIPSAVGDSLFWSGTSTAFVGQGELLWSNILGTGTYANFETATLATPVPVPATALLLSLGLAILGFGLRRR